MVDAVVTILVPTYNHESYISEAIRSIMAQSILSECYVIISDDRSSDETLKICSRACEGQSNVFVRQNDTNLGVMPHYIHLLSQVTTPYVAILEGDDAWISPRKLEDQLNILESIPDVGMCFSACIVDDEASGRKTEHPIWGMGRNRTMPVIDLIYDNPIATFSNCFYRTSALRDALSWPPALTGYDWLCNLKIALTHRVHFLGQPSTLYRVHKNGTWSRMPPRQKMRAIRQTLVNIQTEAPPNLEVYIADAIRSVS